MYDVELEVYQGPMDLLLELIQKNELDIYDIPIAFLTREFLKEMDKRPMDMNNLSGFLLMASTLLAIKSKMLLPKHVDQEEEEEEDPRKDLVEKLLEYKAYKEVARELKDREIEGLKVWTRLPQEVVTKEEAYLLQDLDSKDLMEAFQGLLERARDRSNEEMEPIYAEKFKLTDCILHLREGLARHKRLSFESFLSPQPSKEEIITYFLALLELAKTGACYILYDPVEKKIDLQRRGDGDDKFSS